METLVKYAALLLAAALTALSVHSCAVMAIDEPRQANWTPYEAPSIVEAEDGSLLTGKVMRKWDDAAERWRFKRWTEQEDREYIKKKLEF